MGADATIAVIRSQMRSWFAARNGARGWIIGSFMCLWFSAFDRHGPMVLARVKYDHSGTRIVGRAGADLNGTLMFLLLTPIMAWLVVKMLEQGQGSTRMFAIIFMVFGLGLPLTLWVNHKDRAEADPLVNFLRKAVGASQEAGVR